MKHKELRAALVEAGWRFAKQVQSPDSLNQCDWYELLGHKRDTPGGTQYVVRRSGFAKPTTLHHSCHVEIIKDTP